MGKKIICILMILLLLPIVSFASDNVFYEAYTDSWNGYGIGRVGQGNALRMQFEQPWEYADIKTTPAQRGGDGVIKSGWEDYEKYGKCVYWIQTADFPEDDTLVLCADTSLDDPYILPKGTTSAAARSSGNAVPQKFEGCVKFTGKFRFDDYNADRYVFSIYTQDGGTYDDYIWFDKNGKMYATYIEDGIAKTKDLMSWQKGMWYTVSLIMDFDHGSIDVSVNGEKLLSGARVKNNKNWSHLIILMPKQQNTAVKERTFANSYISGVIGEVTERESEVKSDDKYYFALDFTLNNTGYSRGSYNNALQCNARQPWTYSGASTYTNIGNEGMLPFEDVYRGIKKVYLLRTGIWPKGDTEEVIRADNSKGVPAYGSPNIFLGSKGSENPLLPPYEKRETNTVRWNIKVRFDDKYANRNIFSMGYYKDSNYAFSDFITFRSDGRVGITFQNGASKAVYEDFKWQIGKWHNVELTMRLDKNIFDVYIDDVPLVTNVKSICDFDSWERIKIMEHSHLTNASTLKAREFSNSYIDYVTAEYIEDKNLIWAKKEDIKEEDGKVYGSVSVTNADTDMEILPVKVFMAVYEGDALCFIKSTSSNLSAPKTKTFDFMFDGEEGKSYNTKLLAFRGDSLAPLTLGEGVSTYMPEYYHVIDFTVSNTGYSRGSYSSALQCAARQPWTYTGASTETNIGTEGMAPFSEDYTGGAQKVYWIKTGVWPEGDEGKVFGAENKAIVPKRSSPCIFTGPASFIEENRKCDRVVWEMRFRADDYKSDRNIFVMGFGSSYEYTNFIAFSKDGKVKVTYKNDENKNVTNSSATWQSGVWQDVKLQMDFEKNTFSFYLGGKAIVKDAVAPCDLDNFTRMKIFEQSHLTKPADISEREFSNSYIDYIKAQYEE